MLLSSLLLLLLLLLLPSSLLLSSLNVFDRKGGRKQSVRLTRRLEAGTITPGRRPLKTLTLTDASPVSSSAEASTDSCEKVS
jgi:hypothetical protein